MKLNFKLLLLQLLLWGTVFVQATEQQLHLPIGRWEYTVLHNGEEVGKSLLERSIIDKKLVTNSELSFKAGSLITVAKEVIQESLSFQPIMYRSVSTYMTEDYFRRIDLTAEVKNNILTITDGTESRSFKFNKNIIFGINKQINHAMSEGLPRKFYSTFNIYDPSYHPTKAVSLTVSATDQSTQSEKNLDLRHLVLADKNKKLADIYLTPKGVIYRYILTVQNEKIELILK